MVQVSVVFCVVECVGGEVCPIVPCVEVALECGYLAVAVTYINRMGRLYL